MPCIDQYDPSLGRPSLSYRTVPEESRMDCAWHGARRSSRIDSAASAAGKAGSHGLWQKISGHLWFTFIPRTTSTGHEARLRSF
jgi:hypothetical protein